MKKNQLNLPASVTLNLVQDSDKPLLYQLYVSTRSQEMAMVDWDEAQKADFLGMQFKAQLKHYQEHFPDAKHSIIYRDEQAIGRIYVNYADDEVRLLDITLLPHARNAGIGTFLMKKLQAEAKESNKPLRFYVWQLNHNALRWYKRLDCVETGEAGAYIGMEWIPD